MFVCVYACFGFTSDRQIFKPCAGKAIPVQAYYKRREFLDVDLPDFKTVGT
jgi:hypothetical protein